MKLSCDYALSIEQGHTSTVEEQVEDGFGPIIVINPGVGAMNDHERTCNLVSWVSD